MLLILTYLATYVYVYRVRQRWKLSRVFGFGPGVIVKIFGLKSGGMLRVIVKIRDVN